MVKRDKRELMMITLEKAIGIHLATLETEGKSPRYIDWLKTRLRFLMAIKRKPTASIMNPKKLPSMMATIIYAV